MISDDDEDDHMIRSWWNACESVGSLIINDDDIGGSGKLMAVC